MRHPLCFIILGLLSMLPLTGIDLVAQEETRTPSAKEVLENVRYSQSAESQVFDGEIRPRKIGLKSTPMRMELFESGVRFLFFEGNSRRNKVDQVLELKLVKGRYLLTEPSMKGNGTIPLERYSQRVRGSDIVYEDIAMRFLYWPDPRHLKVEKAKGGMAWKIRCVNPDGNGPYSLVDVWVSQESGALVRMNGFDSKRRLIKSFEIESVQRHKGGWMLRMMNIRTYPTSAGGHVGSTYLKIELPD
ncbi:MAG: outer membrane lipoprotein-sorting protein [Verrucomicrobiaceae bacterium]|nr:outer membrane lipoprotein-sorting protein [Verrucomicrobiaceae bacterium]